MSDDDLNFSQGGYVSTPQGYALSGKIMLSAIIILFTVVILIVCFHIYARWFLQHHRPQPSNLSRIRRRRRHHRRTHRTHFIFTSNPLPGDTVFNISRGLDSNVLKSIPIFTYSAATHNQKKDENGGGGTEDGDHDVLECAVCLSEFEENEIGRILPKCKHSFHVECIDMWFHSHSTCPLCRTPVTPETTIPTNELSSSTETATIHELTQIVIDSSSEQGSSTSNQPCTSCRNEGSSSSVTGSSSSSNSVSPLSIEVRTPEESNLKSLIEDTAGQQGLKSPRSRMLSFKRILSRERRMSSMSNSLSFCSYVTDNTVDHDEENQVQVQVQQTR